MNLMLSAADTLSGSAKHLVLQHFARGRRSRWTGASPYCDFGADQPVLDQLVAAGVITKHRRWKTKVLEYRGTAACGSIVSSLVRALVPTPGSADEVVAPFDAVEHRMVPDPSMTDAEYFHQRNTKPGPHVGKVLARINMLERIGGFARLGNRTEAQEAAAERFRGIFERAQIGGAKALDYAAVKVDTSGPSENAAFEIGEAARYEYRSAVQALGLLRSSLVERVVVHDVSLRKIASGSRSRARVADDLRDALNDLAAHFAAERRRKAA